MPPVQASVNFKLPLKITKRRKWYVASCPIVDVHSQGESVEQARRNLVEALSLFFVSCLERNTLDDVLKKCGLTVARSLEPIRKKGTAAKEDLIDVPIPLLVSRSPQRACHV